MPLLRTTTLPANTRYSRTRANRAVKFVEKATCHTKSTWSGKPFELDTWQSGRVHKDMESGLWLCEGLIRPLFGAVKYSPMFGKWVRRFSLAWLELARKNGKSEIMAALGLYLLIADGEMAAEIYGAASDRDQAAMVFDVARDMIALSPVLRRMKERGDILVKDAQKRIVYVPTRSFYQVVAADAAGNLGANPYAILFDEVLAQPNRNLWDYLKQGEGTRAQSLLIGVTTAGPDRDTFAYAEHEFSIKVAADPELDPSRFVFMANVAEDADWEDETLWPEANPALWTPGHPQGFLDIDKLRSELLAAKNKGDLSEIANFRIFRLNQWGNRTNAWLDIAVWDESELLAGEFTDNDLAGVDCVGGLDLAETTDLAAWVLVFYTEDRVMVKPHFWITRKAIHNRHQKMYHKFLEWEQLGILTVFDQDVHDYDKIREHILADIETYRITDIGYDQFQAPQIVSVIEQRTDVTCEKVAQTTTRMNPGSKELTRILGVRRFTTNANPIMRWNASMATYKMDADKHIKPDKSSSTDSIDGIVALVNALTVAVQVVEQPDFEFYTAPDEPKPERDPYMDEDW